MKYLHRFLSFVAKRMVMFTAVTALLILAFYLAMNTANIYLLLEDGMSLRVKVILQRDGAEELSGYFTDDFLKTDETLNIGLSGASPYVDYTITDYNYRMSLEWVWAWPWENTATATIEERVPRITGRVNSDRQELVTAWYGGRYTVYLARTDGRWKIDRLVQTKLIVEETEEEPAS